MPDVSVLEVLLHGEPIGTLTFVPSERTLFAFSEAYIEDAARPLLSLSFKDAFGGLITEVQTTRVRVPPFFANMLPEGPMREYLARRADVSPTREFFLLWILGRDLPGAVTIRPVDGQTWPPGAGGGEDDRETESDHPDALRFSLAGVGLKFSAVNEPSGGLTIPARGIGGSWIVKLPSTRFASVPRNEFAMLRLASLLGMTVPEIKLVELDRIASLPQGLGDMKGPALAVKRFDRTDEGGSIHIEDFAQIFSVYPNEKYEKASYRNIARVIAAEAGLGSVEEFIRRLVFNTLIGNADMHLKNWSLIYPDRRHAKLAPAYDFVSTIAFIPDDRAALKYARTKQMNRLTRDELAYLAAKALIPTKLVLDVAAETVARFHDTWRTEKGDLPLTKEQIALIDAHVATLPIARR